MRTPQLNICIRMAEPAEAAQVATVLAAAFAEYRSSYTPAAYAATTPATNEILQRINEGTVWVARTQDALLGTVSAVPANHDFYIRSMAVVPCARGRRVGAALLQCIEEVAAERGYRRLTLCTTPFLYRAIRLYEQFGFQRSNEPVGDLHGTPTFSMVKALTSAHANHIDATPGATSVPTTMWPQNDTCPTI